MKITVSGSHGGTASHPETKNNYLFTKKRKENI